MNGPFCRLNGRGLGILGQARKRAIIFVIFARRFVYAAKVLTEPPAQICLSYVDINSDGPNAK